MVDKKKHKSFSSTIGLPRMRNGEGVEGFKKRSRARNQRRMRRQARREVERIVNHQPDTGTRFG